MDPSDDPIAATIAALDAQRAVLGDEVVDRAIASLRREQNPTAGATDAADTTKRTNVTVLFADLVGSTALSRRVDLEDVHRLTDDVLRQWTRIVDAHRGRVVDYAGDGLVAVFGADAVREDDAERAVRAGLAIAGALAGRAEDARVGLHTGPALIARGVGARLSIHGATVNIAARMEQSAPPGRVRISQDTFRLVRGAFALEPQAPIALKGVGDAVSTFLVLNTSARPFDASERGIEGIVTPLVGRDDELARLRIVFDRCVAEHRLLRVAVRGEAGMGKTRLLAEFDRSLPRDVVRLYGRTRPDDRDVPYALIRDLLRNHCGIGDADPPEAAWTKLLDALRPLFGDDATERARWIALMIGVEPGDGPTAAWLDARQLRAQAFHATTTMVRRLRAHRARPLAFFLEDLHWSDEGSLRFLDHLASSCDDLPVLIVGLTRPTSGDTGADTLADVIDLAPMTRDERRTLADALLARFERPPARLRELLVTASDGNPFFAEEILASLIDRGVGADEGWTVDDEAPEGAGVPSTLAGLLQSRIDTLSGPQRRALEAASVVGYQFFDEIVASIEPGAGAALADLVHRDLVVPISAAPLPEARGYVFRHHLLHQVAYDSVLRPRRRALHRVAAEWLVATGREDAFLATIAEHFDRAEDGPNAVRYLGEAGDDAARASAHEAAARLYGRALARVAADDLEKRFDLIERRRNATRNLAQRDALAADVEALETIAEALDDDAKRMRAANVRAAMEMVLGRFPQTRAAAVRTVELAAALGVPWEASTALQNWSRALLAEGDLDGARQRGEEARRADEARPGAHEPGEATPSIHNTLGILAVHDGRLSVAAAHFEASRDASSAIGMYSMEGHAVANLADLRRQVGRYDEAERLVGQARERMERGGRKTALPHLQTTRAQIAQRQERPEDALVRLDDAACELAAVADRDLEGTIDCIRGHALVDLGRLDEAETAYRRALAIFEELGRSTVVCEPLAGLAAIRLVRDDVEGALEALAPLLDRFERGEPIGHVDDLFRIYLDADRVLRRAGDPRAHAWLASAHALLRKFEGDLAESDRAGFLANIPSHRELLRVWARETPTDDQRRGR